MGEGSVSVTTRRVQTGLSRGARHAGNECMRSVGKKNSGQQDLGGVGRGKFMADLWLGDGVSSLTCSFALW